MFINLIMTILCIGTAAFCFAMAIIEMCERRKIFGSLSVQNGEKKTSLVLKFLALMPAKLPKFITLKNEKRIEGLIERLGLCDFLNVPKIYFGKMALACLGAIVGFLLFQKFWVISTAAGGFLGWAYIMIWLKSRVRERRVSIELALPGVLDWLALSVEAGLDFAQAIHRIALRMDKGAFKGELARFESDMKLGMSRREALSSLGRRVSVPAISSFTALLIQADRLGASIGPVLRICSSRLRTERFNSAEKKGAQASQKAILPVVLFIMPATFVVIFGPLIVRFAIGGLEAFL